MSIGTSDGDFYPNEFHEIMGISGHEIEKADDYDYAGFNASGMQRFSDGHWPDTFKLPTHITFSDESKYHGQDGEEGGHWQKLDTSDDGRDRWSFTPGASNFKYHSFDEMQQYFKKYAPGDVLNAVAGNEAYPNDDMPEHAPLKITVDKIQPTEKFDDGPTAGQQFRDAMFNGEKPTIQDLKRNQTDMEVQQEIYDNEYNEDDNYAAKYQQVGQRDAWDKLSQEIKDHLQTVPQIFRGPAHIPGMTTFGGAAPPRASTPLREPTFSDGPIMNRGVEVFRDNMANPPNPIRPGEPAPRGTMQREGQNTFNREVGRSPADSTFRGRRAMEEDWATFASPRNDPLRYRVRSSENAERQRFDAEMDRRIEALREFERGRDVIYNGRHPNEEPESVRHYYEGDREITPPGSLRGYREALEHTNRELDEDARHIMHNYPSLTRHIVENGPDEHTSSVPMGVVDRIRAIYAAEQPGLTERLMEAARGSFTRKHGAIEFKTESGKSGVLNYTYNPNTKDIYVDWMGGQGKLENGIFKQYDIEPHELSSSKVQETLVKMFKENPDAETFSATRISGTRRKVGKGSGNIKRDIPWDLINRTATSEAAE